MLGLPPAIFFREVPSNWAVGITHPNVMTLMKINEPQQIDTSITCSSFQRHPDTTIESVVQEVRREVVKPNSNFIPLLNEGEFRLINDIEFVILGGIFDLEGIGTIIQTAYLNLDYSPTELNIIEIFTTMLFENALDDEPEIHAMLDKVIIASPKI